MVHGRIRRVQPGALHDAPATRGLLERLLAPAAYYAHEVPVVLPVGPLEEGDLIVRESESAIDAWEDPQLEEVPEGGGGICPDFDLRIR